MMIRKVLLDANVLYSAPLRDFFLNLADVGMYIPKWTDEIHNEWIRNLLKNRPDIKEQSLRRAQEYMNSAFPDSNISDYEIFLNSLNLPDENDKHVLAAAIKGRVDFIATFNTKDFPQEYISSFGLEVLNPDQFTSDLFFSNPHKVSKALDNQVKNLSNPPKSRAEVLNNLYRCELKNTVENLRTLQS